MSRYNDAFNRDYAKQQKKGLNTSKIFLDPKDEEEALNIFAEDGFFVDKASYWDLVTFRIGKPSFVRHRVDFRWFRGKEDYTRYLSERALAGWSHVWGNRTSGRHYWICDVNREGVQNGKREEELFPRLAVLTGRRKRLLSQILALSLVIVLWILFLFAVFGVTWRAFWLWGESSLLLQIPILFLKTGPLLALIGFWFYYSILYFRCGKLMREEA